MSMRPMQGRSPCWSGQPGGCLGHSPSTLRRRAHSARMANRVRALNRLGVGNDRHKIGLHPEPPSTVVLLPSAVCPGSKFRGRIRGDHCRATRELVGRASGYITAACPSTVVPGFERSRVGGHLILPTGGHVGLPTDGHSTTVSVRQPVGRERGIRHFGHAPTNSAVRDYGAGQSCRNVKHFAGGAARARAIRGGIIARVP